MATADAPVTTVTTVTTVGTGSAAAAPDAMRVDVAVSHRARSVSDALAGCASAVERFGAVARRVAADEDIASCGFHVHRDPSPDSVFLDVATHRLSVRCGFDQAGDLIAALGDALGDRLSVEGIAPMVTDPAPLQRQAREEAFRGARSKADELAALAGQRVVGALRVVEGAETGSHEAAFAAAGGRTFFEPGASAVSATVTVTWSTQPA